MNPKNTLLTTLLICISVFVFTQDFWHPINSVPDSSIIRCMTISQEGDIYIGMNGFDYPGGIYRSTDNAQSWQYLGLTEKPVYTIEVCPNGDILAGVFCGMYKSIDNGETWYEVYFEVENVTNIFALANGYVFAGGTGNLHGILRSTDFGETWDTNYVFPSYWEENLNVITISPEGFIYAGTSSFYGLGGIYYSENLGGSWTQVDPISPIIQGYELAFHPLGDLFVGCLADGLYRRHSNTGQWSHDFYNVTPDDILFVGNNKIYVGCNGAQFTMKGIYYSDDGGQTYNWLNSGMNGGEGAYLNQLNRHPDNYIYAQSLNLYRSVEPVITSINNSYKISAANNFPNPFSEKTNIRWDKSEKDEFVNLHITAVSGKSIMNEKIKNTGNYEFKNESLKAGIYYYSIISKHNTYSGKMLLNK